MGPTLTRLGDRTGDRDGEISLPAVPMMGFEVFLWRKFPGEDADKFSWLAEEVLP